MTNANKVRGDKAERAVRDYSRKHGFPGAERTKAGYERDGGDVHLDPVIGIGPGCIVQVKDVAQNRFAAWFVGLRHQLAVANAVHGVVVVRRRGIVDTGQWLAALPYADYLTLLRKAGYGSESTDDVECTAPDTEAPHPIEGGDFEEYFDAPDEARQ